MVASRAGMMATRGAQKGRSLPVVAGWREMRWSVVVVCVCVCVGGGGGGGWSDSPRG